MQKKYEFTGETKQVNGVTVKRIKAVKDFGSTKAGELGGWIENESNLSHEGNCWIADEACVYGNAHIGGDACVDREIIDGDTVIIEDDYEGDYEDDYDDEDEIL